MPISRRLNTALLCPLTAVILAAPAGCSGSIENAISNKTGLASPARSATAPARVLIWPTSGPVASPAGPRTNPVTRQLSCHAGIDIAAGYGQPILAAATGTVIKEFYSTWDGNVTIVAHDGGLATWYAHQSSRAVPVGAHVSQGQTIGYVGATGLATGPHLHFNVTINGVLWDPMGWFGGPPREVGSLCAPPYPKPIP
jgi:murein DD-endopeptidase MepM/ murein hydrolase activator NlpD